MEEVIAAVATKAVVEDMAETRAVTVEEAAAVSFSFPFLTNVQMILDFCPCLFDDLHDARRCAAQLCIFWRIMSI